MTAHRHTAACSLPGATECWPRPEAADEIRDALARAMFDADNPDLTPEHREELWKFRGEREPYVRHADAVFASSTIKVVTHEAWVRSVEEHADYRRDLDDWRSDAERLGNYQLRPMPEEPENPYPLTVSSPADRAGLTSVDTPNAEQAGVEHAIDWLSSNGHESAARALGLSWWGIEHEGLEAPDDSAVHGVSADSNAWHAAVHSERLYQFELGYDAAHDDRVGVDHLLMWAQEYARHGMPVKSSALIEAARAKVLRDSRPRRAWLARLFAPVTRWFEKHVPIINDAPLSRLNRLDGLTSDERFADAAEKDEGSR